MLARQEWYDAELRHTGILVHAEDSRRHMIVCFLFRRLLALIASTFFFGQLIMLIIISIKKQASDPTPASLSIWMRTSQISCALLVVIIQVYHYRAVMGLAALHDAEIEDDEEEIKKEELSNVEEGKAEQPRFKKIKNDLSEDSRELSYSEIVTGDRSNCGYTSHHQRTETYLVGHIDDDDDDSDFIKKSGIKGQRGTLTREIDTSQRHISRRPDSIHDDAQRNSNPQVMAPKPNAQNDLASLLSENHHSQLTAPHYPIVTDNVAWIVVLATSVCFLITSIPASLRSYVSAFILYSLTSRILEIAAASLLLSPFKIQNTSLRRRLAARIMDGPSLCSGASQIPTALCPGERHHVMNPEELGRRKMKGRYSEVRSDNSPSSLTVSIMHRPSVTRACPLADSKQNKIELKTETKSNKVDANVVEIIQSQILCDGEQTLLEQEVPSNYRIMKNHYEEVSDDREIESEELINEVGTAWVDRWAQNIGGQRRIVSTNEPNVVDQAAETSVAIGRISAISSVTQATSAILLPQRQRDSTKGLIVDNSNIHACPPFSSFSNAEQTEGMCVGSASSQFRENPTGKRTSRDFSSWTKKISTSPRVGQQLPVSGSNVHREKSIEDKEQSLVITESPRSVANVNDPISPLTTSVISRQKSRHIKVTAAPSACLVLLADTRPQDEGRTVKTAGTISIDTNRGSKGIGASHQSYRAKDDKYTSNPHSEYFEKWTNQSQSQSKLTRRSFRINYDDSSPRSPMSPATPDINFFDGDGEKERYRKGRSGSVKGPVPPTRCLSSQSILTGSHASVGSKQVAKPTDILSLGSQVRPLSEVDNEKLNTANTKGTLIPTTGDLRYFLKKT